MLKKLLLSGSGIVVVLALLIQLIIAIPVQAAGATSNVHVVKYAADGATRLAEKTVSYQWMQQMLPVHGDGQTHYYHQGPIFEGDMWDPQESHNLKDKGAVKGTAVKDLCDLVGGMSPGDEVMLVAVDGWNTEFAYNNIYQPVDQQGLITLCWYNGEDSQDGEAYGEGYPGDNAYHTALQIVFMKSVPNSEGQFVFGNSDMKVAFPEEKYQHFYDGQYPSSNGLSGKWIAEVRIYSGGVRPGMKIDYTTANYPQNKNVSGVGTGTGSQEGSIPWLPVGLGIIGILIGVFGILVLVGNRLLNIKIGAVLIAGILLILSSVLLWIHPWQTSTLAAASDWKLQLVGAQGQQRSLTLKDIRDLTTYTGHGGYFTTVGVVYGPYEAKGVPLNDLCQLVGGITGSEVLMISASDGYSTVFEYDQVMGKFITYDPKTLKEVSHGELKVILMYLQNGQGLSQDDGRPLRIAIVGTDGLLTEGNNWVKWVNKIEVLQMHTAAP